MKKIVLVLLCLGGSSYADVDKKLCIELVQMTAVNTFVETSCDFKRSVGAKLFNLYSVVKCDKYISISSKEHKKIIEIALDDTGKRFRYFGKKEFCAKNRQGYNDDADFFDGKK